MNSVELREMSCLDGKPHRLGTEVEVIYTQQNSSRRRKVVRRLPQEVVDSFEPGITPTPASLVAGASQHTELSAIGDRYVRGIEGDHVEASSHGREKLATGELYFDAALFGGGRCGAEQLRHVVQAIGMAAGKPALRVDREHSGWAGADVQNSRPGTDVPAQR